MKTLSFIVALVCCFYGLYWAAVPWALIYLGCLYGQCSEAKSKEHTNKMLQTCLDLNKEDYTND